MAVDRRIGNDRNAATDKGVQRGYSTVREFDIYSEKFMSDSIMEISDRIVESYMEPYRPQKVNEADTLTALISSGAKP